MRRSKGDLSFQVQSFEWSLISDAFFVVKLEFFRKLVSDCEYISVGRWC